MQNLITKHLDIWTAAHKTRSGVGRGSSNKLDLYGIKKLRELIYSLAANGTLIPSDIDSKHSKLSDVTEFIMGQAPAGSECNTNGIGTIFVKTGEFGKLFPEVKEWTTKPLKMARKGDVLICVVGATIGKLNFGIDCAIGRSVAAIRPNRKITTEYLYISLVPFTLKLRQDSRGSAQGVIGKAELSAVEIRVPNLDEQHRTVAKVDELMTFCDQLEQTQSDNIAAHALLVEALLASLTNSADHNELQTNWQRITAHFDTLFTTEHSIGQLKQTILQLAVMGKLVPQTPKDEPASELLKKIATEKEQLIKEGKIKKEKPLPEITDEEKPFELPIGWEWCRLIFLGGDLGGGTPSKANAQYWKGNIPWVSPKDMKTDYIFDAQDLITQSAVNNSTVKLIPPNSLLLVVRGMILAHSFPVAINKVPVTINQDMKALVFSNVDPDLLLLIMKGMKNVFVALVDRSSHGTCKLVSEKLWNTVIALPPLAEQHRIVAKVDKLMALCDTLKTNIQNAKTIQLVLADAFIESEIK